MFLVPPPQPPSPPSPLFPRYSPPKKKGNHASRLSSSSASVPYLFFQRNTPTFRIRIPVELQTCLGKSEFRRSLGHCPAYEAKQRALRLATAAFEVFTFVRKVIGARSYGRGISIDNYIHNEASNYTDIEIGATKGVITFYPAGVCGGGNESTTRPDKVEESLVAQATMQYGSEYTGGGTFRGRSLVSLTDNDIRLIANEWLLTALKNANVFSLLAAYAEGVEGGKAHVVSSSSILLSEEYQAVTDTAVMAERRYAYSVDLGANRVEKAAMETDKVLAAHGVKCDQATETAKAFTNKKGGTASAASVPYLRTCQEMMDASTRFFTIMEQRSRGNYKLSDMAIRQLERESFRRERNMVRAVTEAVALLPAVAVQSQPVKEEKEGVTGLKLVDALEQFFDEKAREGSWDAAILPPINSVALLR